MMVGKPVTLVASLSDVSVTPPAPVVGASVQIHFGGQFLLRHHRRQRQRLVHADADASPKSPR